MPAPHHLFHFSPRTAGQNPETIQIYPFSLNVIIYCSFQKRRRSETQHNSLVTCVYSIDIPSRVQRIGSYSFKESGLKRAYFADKDGWKEENSFDYNIDGLDDPATAAGLLIKYNTTRWDNRV